FGDAFCTIAINDSVLMGVGVRRAYNSTNEDNAILMFYNDNGVEIGFNEIFNDQIGTEIKGSDIRNIVRINDSLFMTSSQFGPDFSANPIGELIIDSAANVYNLQSHPNCLGFTYGLIKTSDSNYVSAVTYSNGYPDWDIYVYKIDENLELVPFDPTPHTYDSLCTGGIQSGTIDLTSCFVWTNIGDAPSPKEYYESIRKIPVKAYPNPVTHGTITFEYKNTEHHRNMELRCFDIYGQLVHKERVYRYQGNSIVDVGSWSKGMYVAVVYSNGLPAGQGKFVVQ
ncbi:T9SS type A sorting domain-containing protein, partial [bacterium]|nr:T9SS type A sorting domain-containing protein [bacterium]